MASTGYVQRSSRWQVLNYLGKYWNTKYRMDRLCRPLVHHIFSSWASGLFSLVHLPSLPPVISIVSHLGYNFKNVRNWRSFCRETKQYSKWNYFTVDISMYVCHVHNVETLLKFFWHLGTSVTDVSWNYCLYKCSIIQCLCIRFGSHIRRLSNNWFCSQ